MTTMHSTLQRLVDHATLMGRKELSVCEDHFHNIKQVYYFYDWQADHYTVAIWHIKLKNTPNAN